MQPRRSLDISSKTPAETTKEILSNYIQSDLLVCMPAEVINVDDYSDTQCVDVRPLISDVYLADGTTLKAAQINKVFVQLQSAGGFTTKLPVKVGNKVVLHFSHKSLSDYLSGDGEAVDSTVNDKQMLNDVCATLGFGSRLNNQSPHPDNYILEGDNTSVTITPSGQISVITERKVSVITKEDVDVETEANVNVKCATFTVDAPESHFTGNVTVDGNLSVGMNLTVTGIIQGTGAITSATSVGAPSFAGSGGGGGTMTVGSVTATSVSVNGIDLTTRIHPVSGSSTGVMQ